MLKFSYFCILDFLAVFQMLNNNKIFSIKYIYIKSKTSYQREYRKNMTDEQKQRYREARIHKYHSMTDEQKQRYREARTHKYHNMTDERKQRYKDY